MNPVIIVTIAVAVAITIYILFFHKRQVSIEKRVFRITNKFTMARGIHLWLEDGVEAPNVAAICAGLEHCFERARCRGYTRALNLSDYTIAILKPAKERASDGMPALAIPAGAYAGTIYDKGGYILIAGQMIRADEDDGNIIAIPAHDDTVAESTHLIVISDFEAEHVILCYNDGDEYERTKFHGGGVSHPIIPECDGRLMPQAHIFCGTPLI